MNFLDRISFESRYADRGIKQSTICSPHTDLMFVRLNFHVKLGIYYDHNSVSCGRIGFI